MAMDDKAATEGKPRRRRGWWRALLVIVILAALGYTGYRLLDFLYQGPRTLEAMITVMPGVPVFPYASLSERNITNQRLMAIPLTMIRWQGTRCAETALVQAPADHDFIVRWYREAARAQNWVLTGRETTSTGERLTFLREREGLQLIIGPTAEILTPIQYLYMDGLTARQVRELAPNGPLAVKPDPLFAIIPHPKLAKIYAKAPAKQTLPKVIAVNKIKAPSSTSAHQEAKPAAPPPVAVSPVPAPRRETSRRVRVRPAAPPEKPAPAPEAPVARRTRPVPVAPAAPERPVVRRPAPATRVAPSKPAPAPEVTPAPPAPTPAEPSMAAKGKEAVQKPYLSGTP